MPSPVGFIYEAAEFIVFGSTNLDHELDLGTKEQWLVRGFIIQRKRPPFGHKTHLRGFKDPDLLQYDEVWAVAGTWNDVFGIEPHKLVEASGEWSPT